MGSKFTIIEPRSTRYVTAHDKGGLRTFYRLHEPSDGFPPHVFECPDDVTPDEEEEYRTLLAVEITGKVGHATDLEAVPVEGALPVGFVPAPFALRVKATGRYVTRRPGAIGTTDSAPFATVFEGKIIDAMADVASSLGLSFSELEAVDVVTDLERLAVGAAPVLGSLTSTLPAPPASWRGYNFERPSFAVIASGEHDSMGCVLWTAGPHVRLYVEEYGFKFDELGLDPPEQGIWVWEGTIDASSEAAVKPLKGTWRYPTPAETRNINAGQCPWNDAEWKLGYVPRIRYQSAVPIARSYLASLSDLKGVTQEGTAQMCGLSPRSFRRKLALEGVAFRELIDEARMRIIKEMLPTHSLQEISDALAFSEVSAFHRAFRRLTGMTPAVARRGMIRNAEDAIQT